MGVAPTTPSHPLSMLTAEEVTRAVEIVQATGRLPEGALFAHIVLAEPEKSELASWEPGTPFERRVRMEIVPGPELDLWDVTVALGAGSVVDWRVVEGEHPTLLFTEAMHAVNACKAHPDYVAALARRGVTDLDLVQIDPWPAGTFGYAAEEGRRIARCLSFVREFPEDNGYARPVEGLLVHVDIGRREVLEVIDHGVVPLPTEHARYFAADHEPLRSDLKPLHITQPEGPSFVVDGNRIDWQKWSVRVTFDPYEGLVLHGLSYDGRSVAHRLSISEMVVPYGDPGEVHGFKNAFDAGEWGLGRMTQSLTLGCDCLGEIFYFDAVLGSERGTPWTIANAICMHEEDYGIGWKHVDLFSGTSEVRRSRRLVISHIATVGNYEYGFYWYLYLDGNVQLEVKLTGILSVGAMAPGEERPYGTEVAPGVYAPVHQHLFCARLDLDVDGPANTVVEVEAEVVPPGPENPWGNAFRAASRVLATESEAQRDVDVARSRTWRVINESTRNGLGRPTGYKLIPTMSTPTMLADPSSSVGRRAGFARHNLWVTPYAPDELRAAGDHPNQSRGGDGLPAWTAADRDLVDTDVVLWYGFGITHFPRPEDWPVMPVEYTGFLLAPVGFFDRNPALDVPPSPPGACH